MAELDLPIDKTVSRLEKVQDIREQVIDHLMNKGIDSVVQDEGMSIMLKDMLKDMEKQELHKHKTAQDKIEGDENREIARRAIEISNELRRQRRNQMEEHHHEDDSSITIPQLDKNRVAGDANQTVVANRMNNNMDWYAFQREMVGKGLDPRRKLDPDTGEIIYIKNDEDEDEPS